MPERQVPDIHFIVSGRTDIKAILAGAIEAEVAIGA